MYTYDTTDTSAARAMNALERAEQAAQASGDNGSIAAHLPSQSSQDQLDTSMRLNQTTQGVGLIGIAIASAVLACGLAVLGHNASHRSQ